MGISSTLARKVVCCLLTFVLCFGMIPGSAFASSESVSDATESEQVQTSDDATDDEATDEQAQTEEEAVESNDGSEEVSTDGVISTQAAESEQTESDEQEPISTLDLTGTGTDEDPYIISTASELVAMAEAINGEDTDMAAASYKLGNNIDLSTLEGSWTPIGISSNYFTGSFDGDGYTISGLYISGTSNLGLFGYAGTEDDPAEISNLVVKGSITATGAMNAGIVARTSGITMTNVGNEVEVSSTGNTNAGLIGICTSSSAKVVLSGCYNSASIQGASYVGGLIGYFLATELTIENCYNSGTISASSTYAGGIVASISGTVTSCTLSFSNVFNYGTVTASTSAPIVAYCYGDLAVEKMSNVYYLEGCATGNDPSVVTSSSVSATEMASDDFAVKLGGAFTTSDRGYPILLWESNEGVPIITEQPRSYQDVVIGGSAIDLVVEASLPASGEAGSGGTLSYQWYSNTSNSYSGSTPIKDATSDTYTPSTDTLGSTWYYCVVTNTYTDSSGTKSEASATSTLAQVYVTSGIDAATPIIITQPESAEYVKSDDDPAPKLSIEAGFSTEVEDGKGVLSYQWYTCDEDGSNPVAIEGATEATYAPDVTTAGTTYYYCEVTNTFENITATVTSDVVSVKVISMTISTADELTALATMVNGGDPLEGEVIEITADIDLSTVCSESIGSWTPIGTYSSSAQAPFSGTLEGNGHTISGLYIYGTSTNSGGSGLFGCISGATIKNLVVEGEIYITSSVSYIGGVVANVYAGDNVIENVGSNVDIDSTSTSSQCVGGIVGGANNSSSSFASLTITNCYNKGEVKGGYRVGGILGYLTSTTATNISKVVITSCYNTANVHAYYTSSTSYAGGISGHYATILGCYNTGTITNAASSSSYANSIAAYNGYPSADQPNYWLTGSGTRASYTNYSTGYVEVEDMSAYEVLTGLNSALETPVWFSGSSINQSSPILAWEVPDGVPIIVSQPEDGWVVVNSEATTTISVSAQLPASGEVGSDGELSYQWYKCDSNSYSDATPIEGATSNTYTPDTSSLSLGDTYYYYCTVTNNWEGDDPAYVSTRIVQVKGISAAPGVPAITDQPSDITASQGIALEEGFEVTVSINTSSGYEEGGLTYQWYSNTVKSTEGGTLIDGATESSYIPDTAVETGDYYYYCIVTNTFEGVSADPVTSNVVTLTVESLEIDSAEDLVAFADAVDSGVSYSGWTVTLADNIDLSTVCSEDLEISWNPIGSYSSYPFSGTFDGQGYTISGLYIDSSDSYQGLFAYINGATIKDLVVQGSVTSSNINIGGVVGRIGSGSSSYLTNVGNEVNVSQTTISTTTAGVGGIAGYSVSTSSSRLYFTNCYNKGNVTSAALYTGGIAGYAGYSTFEGCYNSGDVTSSATSTSAAVAGLTSCSTASTSITHLIITNSYNSGNVKFDSTGSYVGAISGKGGIFQNCYWLEGTCVSGGDYASSESSITSVSSEVLASYEMLSMLNPEGETIFAQGIAGNPPQLYPVLYWEATSGAPVVTAYPSDGWAVAGSEDPVTISVSAQLPASGEVGSEGALTYQWYTCDEDGSNPVAIEGATEATYALNVSIAGTTYYFCRVTNTFDGGQASVDTPVSTYIVHASTPASPTFTTDLDSEATYTYTQTQEVTTPLSVEASVTDSGEVQYQWYVSTSSDGSDAQAITGETNSDYYPSTTELGDFYYYCVATNVISGVPTVSTPSNIVKVSVTPVYVGSAEDLLEISDNVADGNTYEGCTIVLTADIDLTDETWTPIGSYSPSRPFSGILDGDGHTITLAASGTTYVSLIGYQSGATIRNLVVKGSISGTQYLGAIVARSGGSLTLENVGAEVDITSTYTSAQLNVGGLVGYSTGAINIDSCYFKGNIVATSMSSTSSIARVGGLVGYQYSSSNSITITNSYATGSIETKGYYVGGIVGQASNTLTISNCYSTVELDVTVSSTSSSRMYIGALAGGIGDTDGSEVTNFCYLWDSADRAVGHAASGSEPEFETVYVITGPEDEQLSILGDSFVWSTNIYGNGGYPVLDWESDIDNLTLKEMIEEAETNLNSTTVSEDGSDVDAGSYWVTQDAYDEFSSAIEEAQAVLDTETDQSDYDAALRALVIAINAFNTAKQSGSKDVDKSALYAAIKEAANLRSQVVASEDGTDVPISKQWATQEAIDTFVGAIATAQAVAADATATSEDVESAVEALTEAMQTFEGVIEYGTMELNTDALKDLITEAQAALNSVTTSDDGTDVYPNEQWISEDGYNSLLAAIAVAQEFLESADDDTTLQTAVDNAFTTLYVALKDFRDALKSGTKTADKTALEEAIEDARANRSAVSISSDGTDVDPELYWVTLEVSDAYLAAIIAAEAVLNDTDATQEQVEDALSALSAATAAFDAQKQAGTMETQVSSTIDGMYRIAGAGRYDTMAGVVQEAFEDNSSEYVIVASGESYADALAATSLAGLLDAPVILSATNSLSSQASSEIERVGATKAYIIGGEASLSQAVETSLDDLLGSTNVTRLAGDNRYETATEIAKEIATISEGDDDAPTTVVIAYGNNYADALSISPYTYTTASPILLTNSQGLLTDSEVEAILAMDSIDSFLIVGGDAVVSDQVISQLEGLELIERLSGQNRYETSSTIATWAIEEGILSIDGAAFCSGENFPDALASSALCGSTSSVLLLVSDSNVSNAISVISANADEMTRGYFIGGDSAISADVRYDIIVASGLPIKF